MNLTNKHKNPASLLDLTSPYPELRAKVARTGDAGPSSSQPIKRTAAEASAHPFQGPVLQRPFVLIKSRDEGKKLSSLSVFIISKTLVGIIGRNPESVSKTSSGDRKFRPWKSMLYACSQCACYTVGPISSLN